MLTKQPISVDNLAPAAVDQISAAQLSYIRRVQLLPPH